MGENKIDESVVTDMTNAVTSYTSPSAESTTETEFQDTRWDEYHGIYLDILPIKAIIDKKAIWTVGKGYKASPEVKKILDKIRGNGYDTFNMILQNAVRVYTISEAGFFAEIIKNGSKLINIKPLNPGTMKVIATEQGIIDRFVQNLAKGKVKKFKKEQIFYLPYNRIADQIHGQSIVKIMKPSSQAYKEAKADLRVVFHRYVKPLIISAVDTDNEAEIKAYKQKLDYAIEKGENLVIPTDVLDKMERVSIPQYSTLDPLPWIAALERDFLIAEGVPAVVLGSAEQQDKEATAKILYLAWQQVVEWNQMFLQEQVKAQLGLEIELEFPASLEDTMKKDQTKSRRMDNMEAGIGQADGGTNGSSNNPNT